MGHKVLAIFFSLICVPGNYSTVFSFNIFLLNFNFIFFINNNAERRLFVNVNLPVSNCLTQQLTFKSFFFIIQYLQNFFQILLVILPKKWVYVKFRKLSEILSNK